MQKIYFSELEWFKGNKILCYISGGQKSAIEMAS